MFFFFYSFCWLFIDICILVFFLFGIKLDCFIFQISLQTEQRIVTIFFLIFKSCIIKKSNILWRFMNLVSEFYFFYFWFYFNCLFIKHIDDKCIYKDIFVFNILTHFKSLFKTIKYHFLNHIYTFLTKRNV